MPIITTLEMTRSPAGRPRRCAQEVLGEPELGDDLAGGEVAAEALVAGRAEAAADGAAGLRRDAQRAAVVLGNEHGLDRVAVADVEQPLDGAVGRLLLADDRQRPRRRPRPASLSRSDLARSVICAKSLAPRWWIQRNSCVARKRFSPSAAQNAASPSRSKSSRLRRPWPVMAVASQPLQRSAAVDVHAGKKKAISVAAVSAASEPCTALASMLSAKSARMVPLVGLLRVGGAHQVAVLGDRRSRLRAPGSSPGRRS